MTNAYLQKGMEVRIPNISKLHLWLSHELFCAGSGSWQCATWCNVLRDAVCYVMQCATWCNVLCNEMPVQCNVMRVCNEHVRCISSSLQSPFSTLHSFVPVNIIADKNFPMCFCGGAWSVWLTRAHFSNIFKIIKQYHYCTYHWNCLISSVAGVQFRGICFAWCHHAVFKVLLPLCQLPLKIMDIPNRTESE